MRKVKTKRKYNKAQKPLLLKLSFIRYIFYPIKYIIFTPKLLASFACFALAAWYYYSGGYNNTVNWLNTQQNKIAVKSGLVLEDILLEGQEHTSKEDILAAIIVKDDETKNTGIGSSIINVGLWDIKEKLEKLTWVKSASVERQFPSTLSISIAERKPMALWQDSSKVYLIDSDGVVIKEKQLENFSDLIIFVGKDVPEHAGSLLNMIKSQEQLSQMVSSATRISKRRWNVKLYNGIEIKLPEDDPDKAWDYLAKTHEKTKILSSNIHNIDLRVEEKMFVQ